MLTLPLDRPVADFLTSKAITLPDHFTIDQALAFLRANPTDASVIYFYVLDDQRRLVGVLPARRLLLAPGTTPIREQMTKSLITVRGDDTLFDAMELFAMHRLLALPVVDAQGRFLGILDYSLYTEEVFDLAENRQLNEVFQLIGVRFTQARQGGPWRGYQLRMPWLLCNITGGIICAALGSLFARTLQQVVVVSLFIPVILTLAESVAVQSMTLAIESGMGRRGGFRREGATAVLLGLTCGVIVAAAALLWRQPPRIPLVIGGSILCVMLLAALLGRIVPAVVHALKLNPTVASGPVTLAIVDIVTISVYLSAATVSW